MSRAASPAVKFGLLLAVLLITGAKMRAGDVTTCSREIARCLAACRAVCARRITENERKSNGPARDVDSAGTTAPPSHLACHSH
jgi:hypothetical protein